MLFARCVAIGESGFASSHIFIYSELNRHGISRKRENADVRGLSVNVSIFDTQRGLTARQDVYTCCPCTYIKGIGPYHSREAHKPYLWPRDMAIDEHQLVESSIDAALCGGAHALSVLL